MPFLGGSPGFAEMMIIGIIALLLFGKRLPEVARSLGKGIVEFKKGVRGIEDEVESATYSSPSSATDRYETPRPTADDDYAETAAPKFEPPESAPVAAEEPQKQA